MSKIFFQTKNDGQKLLLWDPVRRKHVVLTPEEKVRHQLLAYMVEQLLYPIKLISVEKQIIVNGMKKRYDIVVYNTAGQPILLAECKQPEVAITQKTVEQAARYNITMRVPFLVLTNGIQHFVVSIELENGTFNWLNTLPDYSTISAV